MEIIILAAAGVGLVAFLVLAVLILRQGRSLKELEERIGPPVPPAAAPSLERVRAVAAQSAPAAVVATEAVDQPGPAPTAGEAQPAQVPSGQGDAQPRQTARQAAEARAAEQAAKKQVLVLVLTNRISANISIKYQILGTNISTTQ